ncbi:MAG TPA: class I SAM-dependent methyltransferase [Pyrinomonadaceae bacterium]|nr:class I SAM-dependent methyltransferase [Pyrinomonadaceae bacterium]
MTARRWQQVEVIVQSALDIESGAERDRFVSDACAGDDELRREVKRLISAAAVADSFIESPAWEAGGLPNPAAETRIRDPLDGQLEGGAGPPEPADYSPPPVVERGVGSPSRPLARQRLGGMRPGAGYFGNIGWCDGAFLVTGWMLAPSPMQFSSFALYLNGRLARETKPKAVSWSKPKTLPPGVPWRFEFRLHQAAAEEIANFSRIEVLACAAEQPALKMATRFRHDLSTNVPTPPEELMFRVTGNKDGRQVKEAGLRCASEFLDALSHYRAPGSLRRLLDWGCGCGRVTVHLMDILSRYEGLEVCGCDIDPEAIAWGNEHVRPGHFSAIAPLPPTMWREANFDAVVSCSVFTHLTRAAQSAWLEEMRRIIAPGGLFLASVNSRFPDARIPAEGISDDRLDSMLDGIAPPGYYRGTFQTREYTVRRWSQYFNILDYIEHGLEGAQDLVVMRRPE